MNLVQTIKGFSRYELDMTDFFDVKVFSLNYRRMGCRKQLMPGNPNNHLMLNLLNDEGKFIIIYLHQLVWRQFNGDIPKGFDVHHINFNPSDNRPENLVLLSHSEHIKLHAKIKNEAGNFGVMKKKCLQFDKKGKFVSEFESAIEAFRITGISQSSICKCCQHKKSFNSAGGFIWIYKSEYEKLVRENKWEDFKKNYFKDPRSIPVVALDKEGNLLAEYKSIQEAFRTTGIAQSSICKCCQHKPGHYSAGDLIWIYKDEYIATQTQQEK